MKITFPVLTLCIGGAQRMLVELANGLVTRGHDVTILIPRTGDIEYTIRAKVVQTKNDYFLNENDYPKADLIVSNYYLVVPSAQQASQKGKGVHVRLSLCYEPTFLKDNHKTYPTYHMTKHVMVLSKWQQEIIALNHGIQGHIVPVGVSQNFKNLQLRKNKNPLVITAIVRKPEGGFSWHREQDYLVRELVKVKSRFPHVKLNLLCPPNELASSPSLQNLKKTKTFTFYSPKNDQEMCYHYNQANIFVVSSIYDAACLPGIEAMRCGAALVTTYCGGNTDYARHQENCLMSYRFENRLGQDIIRLIKNPALRQKIAKEGEKEAAKWTWQRSISAFELAIQQLKLK
jgi:glycosyltransferase involved in cell wall biosynthesis